MFLTLFPQFYITGKKDYFLVINGEKGRRRGWEEEEVDRGVLGQGDLSMNVDQGCPILFLVLAKLHCLSTTAL